MHTGHTNTFHVMRTIFQQFAAFTDAPILQAGKKKRAASQLGVTERIQSNTKCKQTVKESRGQKKKSVK